MVGILIRHVMGPRTGRDDVVFINKAKRVSHHTLVEYLVGT